MLKPALTIMAGRTVGYAVLFLLPLVLVRVFDQQQFGTYKQVFLLYGTILNLAQIGMSESLFYFLPGASNDAGRYVGNSLLVLGAIGLVLGAALYAGGDVVAQVMNNPALAPLMPLLSVYFVLMLASYVLEIVMTARHQYALAAASYGISDVARALLIVAPVLVFRTVESLFYGAIVFAALRLGGTLWYCWRQFGAALRPHRALLLRQAAYSLPFAFYVIFATGQESLHQYFVSSWFDAATFAIYSVGCLQVPLVDVVSSSVVNVMMVGMVQALREGRESAVVAMWHDSARKLALLFYPLVALLIVTAHDIITFLFTPAYAASVPIFRAWSIAILFAAIPMDGLLRVYAQTPFLLVINVVRLAIVAAGMYWFVSVFGLLGAVYVTLVAMAAGKALGLLRMRRSWQGGVAALLPWRQLGLIAGMAAAAAMPAWWLTAHVEAHPLARLLLSALVYGIGYTVLAWTAGVIDKSEQEWLTSRIPPVLSGWVGVKVSSRGAR
jgi:O-antigen/teichoic acid export membrane protein